MPNPMQGVDWGGYNNAQVQAPKTPADYGWLNPVQDPNRDYAAFAQLNDMLGLLHQQTKDAYGLYGANQGARSQAIQNASPLGRQKAVDRQRTKLTSAAGAAGKEAAQRLKAQGYGDQSGAAIIDTANAATQAGNEYQNQVNSPESENAALMQAMGLSDPNAVMSLNPTILNFLQSMLGKSQQVDQSSAAERGSGLGGVLGNVAGNLPWGAILGL